MGQRKFTEEEARRRFADLFNQPVEVQPQPEPLAAQEITSKVFRVLKRNFQAPPTKRPTKGWLYREVREVK